MTVKEMKSEFVANELTNLLVKMDSSIKRAEYVSLPNGEEFVHIYDTTERLAIKVCVTADSLPALTRDVLRKIK